MAVFQNKKKVQTYIRDLRKAKDRIGEDKTQKAKGYCLDDEITSSRIQTEKKQESLEKPQNSIVHTFGFSDTFGVLDFSFGTQQHPCKGFYISDSACELGIITSEVTNPIAALFTKTRALSQPVVVSLRVKQSLLSLKECAPKIYGKLEKNYSLASRAGPSSRNSLISTDPEEADSVVSGKTELPLSEENKKTMGKVGFEENEEEEPQKKIKKKLSKAQRLKKLKMINKFTENLMTTITRNNNSQNK